MLRTIPIAAGILLSAAAAAAPAPQFLRTAIRGNYSEMTLGRIIQNRGASPQARRLGTALVHDHGVGLAQAQRIAARLNLRIAPDLTRGARAEAARLQRLSGPSFDREVRRYMTIEHHGEIQAYRAQARSGDRATAGYAAATIPVLQRHLAKAKAIPL